jgi:hypothetical protein
MTLAERLRQGDDSALTEIKGAGMRALYEHGCLEHYHLLIDVLEDRATGSAVVDGVVMQVGPSIAEKLRAYDLLMKGTSRQGPLGGVGGLGAGQAVMGIVILPAPDPISGGVEIQVASEPKFLAKPGSNGAGH